MNKNTNNINASIGANIRSRRKALGWTQEELSASVGISHGNISRVESGKQGLPQETLIKFALALGCKPSDFFDDVVKNTGAPTPIGSRSIPIISYVQAGKMTEAADPYPMGDADDWATTTLDISANAFGLIIRGDSMSPEFKAGDLVIIDPSISPVPGDFVVAKNDEDEATFKKYRHRGISENGDDVFELVPLNEFYPSLRSDRQPLRIIGVMVEHRRFRSRR